MFSARVALGFLVLSGAAAAQQYIISTRAGGAPPPTPVSALNASIGVPQFVAVDGAGNVYFTSLDCVFELDQTGTLTRVAGTSRVGYSGDGGPATFAQIAIPRGVALDGAGNLYIADEGNYRVRAVSPSGIITTVAGNGEVPFTPMPLGDGGPAVNAQLISPYGVAVDSSGNLYIADSIGGRVRRVSPSGTITTVAGDGIRGYSGDGGPATSAQIGLVFSVAVDGAGNLYIGDGSNYRIRKVSPSGIISTVAGNGTPGFSGDGGLATSAQLSADLYVAVDSVGSLYILDQDNGRVRKVTPGGVISTVAGNGTTPAVGMAIGDGGPATSAPLNPNGLAVDATGSLYIADGFDHRIRKVSPSGIITTVAGNGTFAYSGDGGGAAVAQLAAPSGVALDGSGNLYIADNANHSVRKVGPSGQISTVAGNGTYGISGDGGPATSALLQGAWGIASDSAGDLYISDVGWDIRKVSADEIITEFVGNGTYGFSGDGGPAIDAEIYGAQGVALDLAGNLYFADTQNNRVRKVSPNGIITTVAGSGNLGGYSGDGGPATSAQLSYPSGVAVDGAGNLYIGDADNYRVRMVSPNGIITTVAGNGNGSPQLGDGDGGPATSARLDGVQGIAVDGAGSLYIASGCLVRKVSPSHIITTIAGNGSCDYSGDGAAALSAALSPTGLAADSFGNIFIADNSNNAVRVLQPVSGTAIPTVMTSSQLPAGTVGTPYSQALAATGGTPPYSWSVVSGALPAGLSLSTEGAITGTPSAPGSATFVAQVLDERSLSASQTFTLAIAPAFDIASITNGASNLTGSVSPGEIVVLYGSGLGPDSLVEATLGSDGLFDTLLADTTVSFNGIRAPMIYAWATQVAAVVPYETTGTTAQVTVTYQSKTTAAFSVPIASSAPGVFTLNSTGVGQAAAINQDGTTINGAEAPAAVGDIISLYATGEGQTTPSGVDGKPAQVPLPKPNLAVTVLIGGQNAQVKYAGGAPGEVAGLMQVNAQIPSGIQTGNAVPVVVVVGGVSSQAGVTVAIR